MSDNGSKNKFEGYRPHIKKGHQPLAGKFGYQAAPSKGNPKGGHQPTTNDGGKTQPKPPAGGPSKSNKE